jgi:subtilisin family serine protease
MGQGDHRKHREDAVSRHPRIVPDRSTTGGEFFYTADVEVDDGKIVVRAQLLVDRLVVNEVRRQLPEGTRPLPPSDLGRERLRALMDWANGDERTEGRGPTDGAEGQADDSDVDEESGDGDEDVAFVRFELPRGEDLVCLVRRLRQEFGSYVGPNHVLFGEQSFHGSPATPPAPAPPGWESYPGRGASVGRVGVIDTGFADFVGTGEVDRLAGIDRAPFSVDVPDADPDDGKLDWEAGHGTFIAGQIRHALPDADIVVVKGLDGLGSISEADLCHLMVLAARRGIDVLNLSLGGYALDDECPSGLAATIAQLVYQRDVVIVAAAGNKGSDRPFWPAASRHVVAVGALNKTDGHTAWFTNFGPWVDACAPGVDLISWFFDFDGELDAVPLPVVEDFDFWASWSGTSFAAPQFSAAVCGLRAKLAEEGIAIGFRDAAVRLLARGRRRVSGLGTEFDVDIAALLWP